MPKILLLVLAVICGDTFGDVYFPARFPSGSLISTPTVTRTSGIAPLYVAMEAVNTTDTAVTALPFHELQYVWNFGDSAGSPVSGTTWTYGAGAGVNSRNTATGAVTGHVYENAGTFSPSVTIYDGVSVVVKTLPSITVYATSDATNGFGLAANTICVYQTTENFTCPNGGTSHQQATFETAIAAYAATGKQLLFQRGDTFTNNAVATIVKNGPGLIGAYGSGAKPIVLNSGFNNYQLGFGDKYHVAIAACTHAGDCTVGELKDWRVMDLAFTASTSTAFGSATTYTGINVNGQFNQLTFLRIDCTRQAQCYGNSMLALDLFNWSTYTSGTRYGYHPVNSEVAIQDGTNTIPFDDGAHIVSYGTYFGAEKFLFAGNHFDLGGSAYVSHVLRVTYTAQAAIINNDLLNPGPTESSIKLMAPGFPYELGGQGDQATCWGWAPNPVGVQGAGCPFVASTGIAGHLALGGGYTRWVEISDNVIGGATNVYMLSIGAQSQISDERVKDVIIERNYFDAGATTGSKYALHIAGFNTTIRNNIFNMRSAGAPSAAYSFMYNGNDTTITVVPDSLWAYNNSWYSGTVSGNTIGFLRTDHRATNLNNWNNLAYVPNAANVCFQYNGSNGSSCDTITNNNSTVTQMKTVSPLWSNGSGNYSLTTDFTLGTGSYGIGAGATVPLWTDFFGATRTIPYDMGAVKH
jgi:hypothetical protein